MDWRKRKERVTFPHEVKEAVIRLSQHVKPVRPSVRLNRCSGVFVHVSCNTPRYLRPVRDHLVATVETYAPLMARAKDNFY